MNTPLPFKPLHVEDHRHISELIYKYLQDYDVIDSNTAVKLVSSEHILESIPGFKRALSRYDLVPSVIFLFYISNHTTGEGGLELHVDADRNITALWPVLNCSNTSTEFFDVPEDKLKLCYIDPDVSLYRVEPGDYKPIGKLHLDHPYIIDTSVAHRVDVPIGNPLPRLSIGIRFKKQPREYLYGRDT